MRKIDVFLLGVAAISSLVALFLVTDYATILLQLMTQQLEWLLNW